MTKQEAVKACLEVLRDPTQGIMIKMADVEDGYTWAQKGSDVHADAVAKQYPITDMAIVLAHVNLDSAPEAAEPTSEPSTLDGQTGAAEGEPTGDKKGKGSGKGKATRVTEDQAAASGQ